MFLGRNPKLNLTIDQLRAIALAAHSCDESIPEFLFRNKGSEAVHTIQEFEAFLVRVAEEVLPDYLQETQLSPETIRLIDTDAKPPLPTETKQVRDLQVGDRVDLGYAIATVKTFEPWGAGFKVINVEETGQDDLLLLNTRLVDVITHPAAPFATWDDYLAAMERESNNPQPLAIQKLAKDLQVGDVIDTVTGPVTITKVEPLAGVTYVSFDRSAPDDAILLNDRVIDLLPPSGQPQ